MEEKELSGENNAPNRRGRYLSLIIVAALFIIGTVQALSGTRGSVTADINDQYLGVCGTYEEAVFVELSTITSVQLEDDFAFGTCIQGEETKNTVSGTYSNDRFGEYTVHAYLERACIIVEYSSGTLVFNCNSDSNTNKMYDKIVAATQTSP